MQATTTSPPCLQAPCIGETHFIRRKQTEFHMLVFPIQSHRRALAVKKNPGIGRCHRLAAGYRRQHTHPERTGQPAKLIAAAKCYGQRAPLPPVAALVVTHTSPGASCRTTEKVEVILVFMRVREAMLATKRGLPCSLGLGEKLAERIKCSIFTWLTCIPM